LKGIERTDWLGSAVVVDVWVTLVTLKKRVQSLTLEWIPHGWFTTYEAVVDVLSCEMVEEVEVDTVEEPALLHVLNKLVLILHQIPL